ncbi:TonB-dependent receptor [Daejeonella sp.]|uniref:SusC/RagA family TonB-linked outer membrane protein n=1 Tax=Daejeonella sp. TaxID=2805397 RepID=UPI0030C18895
MKKVLLFNVLFWIACTVHAQTRQINGQVIDKTNDEKLIGVSIVVKGLSQGTQTDKDGKFTLSIPSGDGVVLIIRYLGYKQQDLKVGKQNTISVALEGDNIQLNEVVAIGYATVRRRDLTGAVSSIGAKDLQDNPINSAAEILNGKLAGVQVTSSEGSPDADVRIRVRGVGSLTQDASPIYIIDGIQIENGLNMLSPQDIASIDVLKDAASTAIYGARGANGVVIITTKGGKEMKTRISYNASFGASTLANKLAVMDPYEYVMYQYQMNPIDPTIQNPALYTNFQKRYGSTFDTLSVYKNVQNIDWQDELMGRTAFNQNHNVSVSGGSKTTQFNLSLTANDQDAILLNSAYDRKIMNFRFDHTASERLKVGVNVIYTNQLTKGQGVSDGGNVSYNGLRNIIKYIPFDREPEDEYGLYDFNPDFQEETAAGLGLDLTNPVALNNAQYARKYANYRTLNGYFNYSFSKYFSFKSTVGLNISDNTRKTFDDYFTSKARAQNAGTPSVYIQTNTSNTINNSNVFSYNRKINRHSVNLLLGQEYYAVKGASLTNELNTFPIGITAEKALGQLTLGTAKPGRPASGSNESRILSGFSRVNYSYNDKYLFMLTVRADASSKFAADRRLGYFPSGSVAWRVSNENFMKNIPAISDMKLRFSIGEAGNNRISDYLYLNTFSTNQSYYLNESRQPAFITTVLPNKDLRWESTVSRNLGLDIALFNNRIQLTADAYKNTTNDLLVNTPVPVTSGYSTQLKNIGSILNKGLEFQLNAAVIESKNFSYRTDFNISFNRNKILRLAEHQDYFYQWAGVGNVAADPADYIVKVGQPIGTMYGFLIDGKGGDGTGFYTVNDFDYNTATQAYTLKAGVVNNTAAAGIITQPGSIKYKDLNGDGVIDPTNDRTIIGNPNPKFEGGVNQQLRMKQFDLSAFVTFAYGQSVYNVNKIEFTNGTQNNNMLDIVSDRWKKIGENGAVLQSSTSTTVTGAAPEVLAALNKDAKIWTPNGKWNPNSWAVEDGSYLRFSNVTFGYTFSRSLMKRVKVNDLRIYATANNLGLITNYTGYDPQVNSRRGSPLTPNVDYSAYPRSRTFVFGLNLTL